MGQGDEMGWIGIGIFLAIGYYVAPLIIGVIFAVIAGVFYGICRLFGGCRNA